MTPLIDRKHQSQLILYESLFNSVCKNILSKIFNTLLSIKKDKWIALCRAPSGGTTVIGAKRATAKQNMSARYIQGNYQTVQPMGQKKVLSGWINVLFYLKANYYVTHGTQNPNIKIDLRKAMQCVLFCVHCPLVVYLIWCKQQQHEGTSSAIKVSRTNTSLVLCTGTCYTLKVTGALPLSLADFVCPQ